MFSLYKRYYEWNEKDQLAFFKVDAGGGPSVYAHYLYDAGGNRVKKIVWDQQEGRALINKPVAYFSEGASQRAGKVTVYIDGVFEYRLKQEDSTDKEQNIIHFMDDASRIAQVRIGTAFNDDIAESIHCVLDDHLGSSTARLNTSGGIIDRQEFYPFGGTSLRTYNKKRYQYVGKEKDAESGLIYYGARYYAAWTCRFISVDPLASKYQFYSPYIYAGNKPINKIDIDGMQEQGAKEGQQGGGSSGGTEGQSDDGNFWSELGNYVLSTVVNGVASAFQYAMNNPNHAGYDIGAKEAPTQEALDTYSENAKEALNPMNQVESLVYSGVEAPSNLYEGWTNNDGAQFGEGLFQAGEVIGTVYGARKLTPKKAPSNVKKADNIGNNTKASTIKYSEGSNIVWAYVDNKQIRFYEIGLDGSVSIELNIPKALQNKGYGSEFFKEAVEGMDSFKGLWIKSDDLYNTGMSRNLSEFNSNIINGMTETQAAWNTWSGRQAAANGFTEVVVLRVNNGIQTIFTK